MIRTKLYRVDKIGDISECAEFDLNSLLKATQHICEMVARQNQDCQTGTVRTGIAVGCSYGGKGHKSPILIPFLSAVFLPPPTAG